MIPFSNLSGVSIVSSDPNGAKDPDDKYQGYTADLMYECLSSFTLTRDIGTKYEYSNLGYGLLGQVLAKRMGATYRDLVESRITQLLKMKDTRLDPTSFRQPIS